VESMIRQAVLWIVCEEEILPSLYGRQLVSSN